MQNYTVLITRPRKADLRVFQISAESLHAANELAAKAVATLSPEVIEAISVDGSGHGAHVDFVIVDVYEDYLEREVVI